LHAISVISTKKKEEKTIKRAHNRIRLHIGI